MFCKCSYERRLPVKGIRRIKQRSKLVISRRRYLIKIGSKLISQFELLRDAFQFALVQLQEFLVGKNVFFPDFSPLAQ